MAEGEFYYLGCRMNRLATYVAISVAAVAVLGGGIAAAFTADGAVTACYSDRGPLRVSPDGSCNPSENVVRLASADAVEDLAERLRIVENAGGGTNAAAFSRLELLRNGGSTPGCPGEWEADAYGCKGYFLTERNSLRLNADMFPGASSTRAEYVFSVTDEDWSEGADIVGREICARLYNFEVEEALPGSTSCVTVTPDNLGSEIRVVSDIELPDAAERQQVMWQVKIGYVEVQEDWGNYFVPAGRLGSAAIEING